MAAHHLVLSLLEDGPSYGYELKVSFERTVGPQWGAVNVGHVYQLLQRLERDELIDAAGHADPARGPERRLFHVTPRGSAELRDWLATPSAPPAGYRTELFLKVAAAARAGRAQLDALLTVERAAALRELQALKLLADDETSPLVLVLIEGARAQVRARLELLAAAAARRAELGAAPARRSDVEDQRAPSRAAG